MEPNRPWPLGGLLSFVETRHFARSWVGLGLTDVDRVALQASLIRNPQAGPVVPGTGGLRKIRFAPVTWHKGKRGAVRVCYAYFPTHGIVLLTLAYGKANRSDISQAEKKAIRTFLAAYEAQLSGQGD